MTTTDNNSDILRSFLAGRWEQAARKFIELAEALPDDRFKLQLVAGARNCDEVLRHVAFWNRYAAESLGGAKPDDSANELAGAEYPTRARVLQAVKQSAEQLGAAVAAENKQLDARSLELIGMALEHTCEHYGQLAVYARMMGITPPASRS